MATGGFHRPGSAPGPGAAPRPGAPAQLLLAPMEGLLDFVLRDVLTRVGGWDRCVSEFIRITDQLLPERVFMRVMPELAQGSRTLAGVPVRGQLLGSDPACMADNAARLAQLGSDGVDLNFGCPAKVVNRHGGGAVLLQDPAQIHRIVEAVRATVPVSAKMRLGFDDDRRAEECARAIEAGGACELVVHARTRADGYRPPAYWHRVADVRQAVRLPVVANGEIWSVEDAHRCLRESGSAALMIGRGAVAEPGLALAIRRSLGDAHAGGETPGWPQLLPHLQVFWLRVCERVEPRARAGRLKQWLNFLRRRFPEAQRAYEELRTLSDGRSIEAWLARQAPPAASWAARQGRRPQALA